MGRPGWWRRLVVCSACALCWGAEGASAQPGPTTGPAFSQADPNDPSTWPDPDALEMDQLPVSEAEYASGVRQVVAFTEFVNPQTVKLFVNAGLSEIAEDNGVPPENAARLQDVLYGVIDRAWERDGKLFGELVKEYEEIMLSRKKPDDATAKAWVERARGLLERVLDEGPKLLDEIEPLSTQPERIAAKRREFEIAKLGAAAVAGRLATIEENGVSDEDWEQAQAEVVKGVQRRKYFRERRRLQVERRMLEEQAEAAYTPPTPPVESQMEDVPGDPPGDWLAFVERLIRERKMPKERAAKAREIAYDVLKRRKQLWAARGELAERAQSLASEYTLDRPSPGELQRVREQHVSVLRADDELFDELVRRLRSAALR